MRGSLLSFLRDIRGGVAPMAALLAIPLFGSIGAAVDFGQAARVKSEMQSVLDATALMLAKENSSQSSASSSAEAYFNANFVNSAADGVQINVTSSGTSTSSTYALTASATVATRFMRLLGFSSLSVVARGTALAHRDGNGCVLALDGSAAGAMSEQGNTSVTLNGCSMYVNSSSATAVSVGGSARLTAQSVNTVGNVSGVTNITTTDGIHTSGSSLPDPYSDVNYPAFFGCDQNNFSAKNVVTINPGVYCGGMSINAGANVTFNPGIYYIDGGSLSVNGGASISGVQVTIVFTSKNRTDWPTATINGGATVNFTAPTTGATAGLVLFGDRRVPIGTPYKLNGGSSQYFGGAIYIPTGAVDFVGGSSTSTSCTQLIGDTISFSGNANFAINCSSYKTRPIGSNTVRLSS